MKITNKLNLPNQLVKAVESDYQYRDKRYSITSLLNSDRELMLKRRHHNEIEQDVSEMIWMLWGNGVHLALENIELEIGQFAENKMEVTVSIVKNGELLTYTLSGIVDYIDNIKCVISDYKSTSVWSIIYGSNNDKWLKQLQMSAYLWANNGGKWISKGTIIAFLKDWKKRDAEQNQDYPNLPVQVIEFDLGTYEEVEKWIVSKFERIAELENILDIELPLCSLEERFNSGDKYAIKKKANKRASKVHDTLEQAEEHLKALEVNYRGLYEIELRKGEDKKCKDYCSVNKFCDYYNGR